MTPLNPGDTLDHYVIDDLVARGGMASVFRATDLATGRIVALKVPHPETECDPVMFDRFRREIEIGEHIDHPGVAKVYRETRRSRPYMAAEWIDATSLRAILNSENKLPEERAMRLAVNVCEVLQHLHTNGVVHRDLKPDNVMVGPGDSVTLIDFGLASKLGARRLTFGKFSRIMGTADYISPEQVEGNRGDARTDIYALGVILYEMLAGRTPWQGINPFTVMKERTLHEPAPVRGHNSEVTPEVEELIQKALRRDPARRYSTANEFLQALKAPGGAVEPPVTSNSVQAPSRWKTAWISLAIIPVSIFLMLLYVASRH